MFSRRSILKGLLGAAGAAIVSFVSPVIHAKKFGLKLAQLPGIEKPGGSVTIKLGDHQIILVRVSGSKVAGLSAVCTHQKCIVGYDAGAKKIACGCHKSHFDLSGKVLDGPATSPLRAFPVKIDGDRLIVSVDK